MTSGVNAIRPIEDFRLGVKVSHDGRFNVSLGRHEMFPGRAGAHRLGISVHDARFCFARVAQGLGLSVVVKDAAKGIAAGVSDVSPGRQRDDCFHVLYEMNKVRRRLERRAYATIEREGEALGGLGKIRAYDKERRRKAKRELVERAAWVRRGHRAR